MNKFICTVLFFSLCTPVFSQSNLEDSYLCLSYSFGITEKLSPEGAIYGNESGTISLVELSNIPEENTGYFVNFMSTSYKLKELYSDEIGGNQILKNYGVSSGVRIYANNKKVFFDMGLGYYNIESFKGTISVGYPLNGYKKNTHRFGVNIGLGARINLSDANALVLKARLSNIFFDNAKDGFYREIIFNAGLEFDDVTLPYKSHVSRSGNLSSGIILGNTGKYNDKFIGSYGGELTFGISNNVSLVANYLHKSSDEYYFGSDLTFEAWENNYGGGVRNYFGENSMKPFLECLANLNVRKENSESYDEDNILIKNSIGMTFGTGAEFQLNNRVSGILKANFTLYDYGDNAAGMFGGVKYRF